MKIPIVCLGSCSANAGLTRLAKGVFFQLNSKYKVGSSRCIYCSFPLSVKQNTPILPNTCFPGEPYSLPMVSLRTADAFPVVASLPSKNCVCEPERQNDFRDVKPFYPITV